MKVTNETKVGALTAIAITLLILGFNFLKGKSVFEKSFDVYAIFHSVEGLAPSNAVVINGLQVGKVYKMQETDANLSGILVTLHLTKSINIPKNSFASITGSLLGNTSIEIEMGDGGDYIKSGDTLTTNVTLGLLDQVTTRLDPTMVKINSSLQSLDSVLQVVGGIFDTKTKHNFQSIFANLAVSTSHLAQLLHAQNGALAQTLNNVNGFTGNLKNNNDTLSAVFSNLKTTTGKLAEMDVEGTLTKLQTTVGELNVTLQKINNNEGSLGLLMNDKKLYDNLNSSANSLNLLLQDFRVQPRRYTGGLVFGKKDKSEPLMTPLSDTTTVLPNKKKK